MNKTIGDLIDKRNIDPFLIIYCTLLEEAFELFQIRVINIFMFSKVDTISYHLKYPFIVRIYATRGKYFVNGNNHDAYPLTLETAIDDIGKVLRLKDIG